MSSNRFSECIQITANPELVFDFTQNYNNRLKWDKFLVEAYLLSDLNQPEKGAKAWCVSKYGFGMETQYVSFNRPKVTAIKMTKGPYMFKEFAASWRFDEETPGNTKVTFAYSFSLKSPFSLVNFVIRMILQKNVKQRLLDLKNNLTAGN